MTFSVMLTFMPMTNIVDAAVMKSISECEPAPHYPSVPIKVHFLSFSGSES